MSDPNAVAPPTPGLTTPTAGTSTTAPGVTPPARPAATSAAGSAAPATPPKPATPTPSQGTPASPSEGSQPVSAIAPSGGAMPCGVSQALATNCQTCHAATPIAGAPMPLMTQADFHKPAVSQPAKKVFELAKVRIHDTGAKRMPPSISLPAADMTALDQWFDAGAQLSTSPSDASCTIKGPTTDAGGNKDGTFGRLKPGPGETCYEFKVHQSTSKVDDQPYEIVPGEHYEQFYYKVPWEKDAVSTSYATVTDNVQVLHHWLMFGTDEGDNDGFHKTTPLPTLIGTNPVLITGWAVGGPNLVTPPDVGFELPGPGKTINVQWHFYNSTSQMQRDASAIQICTAPAGARKNIGAVTWLGTEDLNGNVWFGGQGMPAHKESTFTATCVPGRLGMGAQTPIQIMGFEPHMHRIGTRMKTVVNKQDGTHETLFDEPFSFGSERHYLKEYTLLPGETLTTSCTFNNTNDFGVPFGESTDSEMCYQFVLSYPAHALSNRAPSLIGVTDTCW